MIAEVKSNPDPVSNGKSGTAVTLILLVTIGTAAGVFTIWLTRVSEINVDTVVKAITALAAVVAAAVSYITKKDVQTVHHNINSRMDLLLKETQERATAEATLVERAAQTAAITAVERATALAAVATVPKPSVESVVEEERARQEKGK